MKKLLSLLSLLIISGATMPMVVATSPYQQPNNLEKLNTEQIQNSNLETLSRTKRQDNKKSIIEISEVVITTNGNVESSGVALNNKVYFGSNNYNVYEYTPSTGEQKVIIRTNDMVFSSGVVLNNKVYFESYDQKVYEHDPLDLIESDIIYMRDHIKRGLYLQHQKQNPNSEIKNILNINLENLTVSDVTIEQTQKNKSSNLEQDLNDVCKDYNSTFVNNSSIEQTQNTVSCSKQLTETNTFQKMNRFSKSETTSNTDN
ncbi:hypothetical protein [Spiroplasma endosymbiont of Agriotes lineatus]|uniref:hypothetical protein n=1 Tax=Spiroplasma endosymbiont of Agriotes lineatus TaxID=3077930 RepID=UPI0030CCF288